MTCLFCNIVNKTIPAKIIYEDDQVIAFEDLAPHAPSHILIIPKQHIPTLNDLEENQIPLAGKLLYTAKKLAKELKYEESGYRIVSNCQKDAGQTVFHLHFHLLAGRLFHWPPG